MSFKRALRYFTIAVAVLLACAAFAFYWYALRPLPQTSGTLTAPVSGAAEIVRDARGVPHISAASIEDAWFLQGFAQAQDRLWQMDALRRTAEGRLSEVLGPATLELDRDALRFRIARIARMHLSEIAGATRAALTAYARGVNYFIGTHRDRLPLEFSLLRYAPAPWTAEDSLAIGMYIYRGLSSSWRGELQKASLLEHGDPERVALLYPVRTRNDLLPGGPVFAGGGSNAWAVAGSRTATGKPILANDPHLEYLLPCIWHMAHLRAPGLNVTGVSFPGLPGVVLGHNEKIAWGVTNLQFDVQDLYIEKLDPQTGEYVYRGKPEKATLERNWIAVRNGKPVEFTQWVTRHGPVIATDGGRAIALRWVAAEPGGFSYPFLAIDQARNWNEFLAAVAPFDGPAQNFVYADANDIGYHAAGRLPVRKTFDGDVPVDGSSGQYEWQGFIPFEQLPQAFNPPSGSIVTANQNPFPADYPFRVNGFFDAPYRANQIAARLASRRKWSAEDMLSVQKDVYSPYLHYIARRVVEAYGRRGSNPSTAGAVAMLRAWDGQVDLPHGAPVIAQLVSQRLRSAIADRASPGSGTVYDPLTAPAVVERILRTQPAGWFTDFDELLLRSLAEALEEGRRIEGSGVREWTYARYNRLLIAHPVLHQLPLLGGYFDIGPVPMPGAHTTVRQFITVRNLGTRVIGPSMRMAVDLSNLDNSYQNIATGESGQPFSSHFKDQWEAHYYGRSFPMQFSRVEAKATLRIQPQR